MVSTLQSNSISSFHFQFLSRATLTMSTCNLTGAAMAACVFPGDIMIEILSRLPVKSLLRFRCVCKSWCSLITNPSFITKHITQTTHNKNENLIIHSGGYKKSKYVISMLLHGDKTLDRSINLKLPFPTISNYVKIVGSCNGLLCLTLSRVGTEIFLWNPATREHRNLPEPGIAIPQGKRFHSVVLGFGFNANTSDYKLVRLFWYKGLNSHKPLFQKTEVYSKKRDSWREIKVVLECRLSESSPTAVLGGGVHWMASGSDCSEVIACFDMGTEVFGEIQLPDSFGFGTEIGKQLAVVKDLLAVIVHPLHREMNKCIDVWVMKEYAVKESWTKQLRIGPFSGVERPITCFRNGKFVLQNNKDKLFLYDSKTREFDNLPVRKARYIYDIHTCMETLVSVKEGE